MKKNNEDICIFTTTAIFIFFICFILVFFKLSSFNLQHIKDISIVEFLLMFLWVDFNNVLCVRLRNNDY